MPKIERTQSQTSARAVEPSGKVASPSPALAPSAQPQAPLATYAGQVVAPKALVPRGTPVTTTASPEALWGEAPRARPVSVDQAAFEQLSPAQKKDVARRALEERAQLGQEIEARVEHLDRKWRSARLTTRTDALREYGRRGRRLPPEQRRRLDDAVKRSDVAQARIDALKARAAALPDTPEAKQELAALRRELARELRQARAEQSAAVQAATAVVDAEGLKADRLAQTEQVIDPQAPAPGSGDSLLDKVVRFLHLDTFISWLSKGDTFSELVKTFTAEVNRRGERLERELTEKQKGTVQRQQLDADRRLTELRRQLVLSEG